MQGDFITLKEAAELLGVTPGTMYKRTSQRRLPYYKPAGKILFKMSELLEYTERTRVATKEETVYALQREMARRRNGKRRGL